MKMFLRLGYGSILGSYTFNKYKTKNVTKNVLLIEIFSPNSTKQNKILIDIVQSQMAYFMQEIWSMSLVMFYTPKHMRIEFKN